LDVHVRPSGEAWRAANERDGIQSLVERLVKLRPTIVVLEASGGFEREGSAALIVAGVPTAVVNPRQVRDFAKALGKLAKTDGVDAEVLSHFAEAIRPSEDKLDDEATQELRALVSRRAQLVEMRTMELNRKTLATDSMKKELDEHIRWLNTRIKDTEREISGRIRKSKAWLEKAELLESAMGIGRTTSAKLIVDLPELGTVSGKRIAALVGTAPYNDESGKHDGKRHCRGGRADVRTALYMPTLSAIRCDPVIKAFHERLTKAGKAPKTAILACMRKLLVMLNAMVRDNRAWSRS
jgi:transposase